MAKEKLKFKFSKISVIVFLVLSLVLVSLLFVFKEPIEKVLNKNVQILDFDGLVMHTIDVGQAEAIMIKLPDGKNMLVDSGNTGKEKNLKLKSYLDDAYFKNLENKEIDYFVITHSDSDHCGGAEMIFEEYSVKKVFRPAIFSSINSEDMERVYITNPFTTKTSIWSRVIDSMYNEPDCQVVFSDSTILISESEYSINFLAPEKNSVFSDVNSYSPLIKIIYKGKSILLTGDATKESEISAIDKLSHCDILNVGHHGSKYSTSQEFLDKVTPYYAVISCNNSDKDYGHPHQEVLNRLLEIMPEKNIYRTDLNGNIVSTISQEGEIGFLVDVESNSYYIKVEYIIVSGVVILFILCFACNKKSTKKSSKN